MNLHDHDVSGTEVPTQIDRRQALKRGAVVGGAVVWATPVVQGLLVRTADAASSTVPPPPPPIGIQSCQGTAAGGGIVVSAAGMLLGEELPTINSSFDDADVCGIGTASATGATAAISWKDVLFIQPLSGHTSSVVTSEQASNSSQTWVNELVLTLPTAVPTVIRATTLKATADTTAGKTSGSSDATSSIGSLSISGTPIALADPGTAQTVPIPGLGNIYLNQKDIVPAVQTGSTWTSSAVATVLRIVVDGLDDTNLEVIVSRAHSASSFTS